MKIFEFFCSNVSLLCVLFIVFIFFFIFNKNDNIGNGKKILKNGLNDIVFKMLFVKMIDDFGFLFKMFLYVFILYYIEVFFF